MRVLCLEPLLPACAPSRRRPTPSRRWLPSRLRAADFARRPLCRLPGALHQLGGEFLRHPDLGGDGAHRRALPAHQLEEIEPRRRAGRRTDKRLAFISDRDGKRQIYLISATGGEALELTALDGGVSDLEWSPDGASIAFTSTGPEPKARKERKEKFGEFEIVKGDYLMAQLWVIKVPGRVAGAGQREAETGEPDRREQILGGPTSPGRPIRSGIAFSATANPSPASAGYERHLRGARLRQGRAAPGVDQRSGVEPGVVARRPADRVPDRRGQGIFLLPEQPDRRSSRRTVARRGSIPMKFDEDPGLVDWGPDGIYFAAAQKTSRHLFRVDPESGSVERITGPDSYIAGEFSFTRDFSRMTFTGAAPESVQRSRDQRGEDLRTPHADRRVEPIQEVPPGHARGDRVEIERRYV